MNTPAGPLKQEALARFEWMQTPIWVFDVTRLRQHWANAAGLEFWNSPSLEEFTSRDFSDMSEAAITRMKGVMVELARGSVLREQWTVYPKGKPVTARVTRIGIELDNGVLASVQEAIVINEIDPSALRGVEAIHHTGVRIAMFSPRGAAMMRNPSALRAFGPVRADSQEDDFANLFLSEQELERAKETLSKGECYSAELLLRTVTGHEWHGLDARKVLDPVTGQAAILVNARDISDRKRAEEAAREALESEKKFLATMSHEIRTPLNSVVGFLDLLRTTPVTDQQRKYLDNAQVGARLLLDLISETLDFSKMDAGEIHLAAEEFDLEDLLLDCLVVASTRVKEGVQLVYRIPELDVMVVGDPTRLKQIIVNLLGNAAKFTESGHISLSLSLHQNAASDSVAFAIEVEDTGIGVPESKQIDLFAPFRQAHNARYGGSGLGLYLSRSLARLMGGDVALQSSSESGTTFCLALTLGRGSDKSQKYSFAGTSLLLLTRDAPLSGMLSEGFGRAGALVLTLPNDFSTQDVLRTLLEAASPFDMLVVDTDAFKEPSVGSALVRLTRDISPATRLIGLITDKHTEADAGFDLRVERPFTYHKLSKSIHELHDVSSLTPTNLVVRTIRVLLVEDVEANVILAAEVFRVHFGLEVDVARDGVEAVDKVQSATTPYDIVFMDIQMPRMDGFEATRRIRALGNPVPIVAMTANALSDQVQNAFDIGMVGYVTKPVRRAQLARVLVKHSPQGVKVPIPSKPPRIDPRPPRSSASPGATPAASLRGPRRSTLPSAPLQGASTCQSKAMVSSPPQGIGRGFQRDALNYFASILDPEQAPRLLRSSMKSVDELVQTLRVAHQSRDREALRRELHALKGVLLNSGLVAPAHCVAEMEGQLSSANGADLELPLLPRLLLEMSAFAQLEQTDAA